jgi:hypothetical protein
MHWQPILRIFRPEARKIRRNRHGNDRRFAAKYINPENENSSGNHQEHQAQQEHQGKRKSARNEVSCCSACGLASVVVRGEEKKKQMLSTPPQKKVGGKDILSLLLPFLRPAGAVDL